jgi:hypothetical protein
MDRPIRRKLRWRPARTDFLTWALSAAWDGFGRIVTQVQELKAAARPRQRSRRRPAPVWFGSRPANS